MTDPHSEAAAAVPPSPVNAGAPTPADANAGTEAGAAAASTTPVDPALERRAFVRRMGGDAVRTAGSVFSLSRILTRSAAAAGQAVMGELQSLQVGNAAEEAIGAGGPADTAVPAESPAAAAPASPTPIAMPFPTAVPADGGPGASTATVSRPPLMIEADQRAILDAATTAVVAVNREGHPPQLTTAGVLWDGETVRFATLGWSRRTTMLRADPRISLLVESTGDGRFVTVAGRARIAEGRAARDAAWPLLLRDAGDGGEAAAEARWQELVAADVDRAVIVVEPDQVLSGRR